MKYQVEYLPQVVKTLEKMDKYTKRIIIEWIEKHLVDCFPRKRQEFTFVIINFYLCIVTISRGWLE